MNILDVAQNGVSAGAHLLEVALCRDDGADRMRLSIKDDGSGMDEETQKRAADPFYTTRTTRSVGLGLPFLKMAAELAGGGFALDSAPGRGTEVKADFALSHIDLAPMGDIGQTIAMLAAADPDCEVRFTACRQNGGEENFVFDTRDAKELLGDVSLGAPEVMLFIQEYVNEHFDALWTDREPGKDG